MTDLGLALFGKTEQEEDGIIQLEKEDTQSLGLDTFSSQDQSLPLDLFGTQQEQKTRRSTVERTEESITPFNITIPEGSLASRNFNPGNLRFVGQEGASKGEGGFARFEDAKAGFEALNKQISLDASRGHTINSFINKFAPPSENDTQGYINFIVDKLDINPNIKLTDTDQSNLAKAMAEFESGTTIEQFEKQTDKPGLLDEVLSESLRQKAQGVKETIAGTVFGMAAFVPTNLLGFSATAMQTILENTGILPKLTKEQKKAMRDHVVGNTVTLSGVLEAKTKTGEFGMKAVEKVISPVIKTVEFGLDKLGVDEQFKIDFPNVADALQFGGEMIAFGAIGGGVRKAKRMHRKLKAGKDVTKEMRNLAEKMEAALEAEPELKDLIQERKIKNQKLIAGAEGFSAIDIGRRPGLGERIPTKSELSQRSQGFEGDIQKPDLGIDPQSGARELTQVKPVPKAEVTFITEEGIPRAKYQIENGKIKEVERVSEKTVSQIDPKTGEVELVEHVPGQRKVWQILTDPLKNEVGAITIPKSAKQLREQTSQSFRENVRRFEKLAKQSGKDLTSFLKDNDFSKKEIKQIKAVTEIVKQERPFEATESFDSIATGKDPLKLHPGEVNINLDKRANPKTAIGDKFFEGIKTAKETKLPSIVKAFTPSLHAIKDMKSPQMLDMWHKVKAIEGNRIKDVNTLKDTAIELRDQYPKKKLREEAFIKIMSADPLGLEALKMMEIEPIKGPIKYEGLVGELEVQFKDMFNQLNTMRESIGKRKIAERASYLPMIAQENFYSKMRKMFKGEKGEIKNPNLVLDSVDGINKRHSPGTVEATNLRHLRRRGLRRGVKLETDPLKLLSQYGSTAYKHIHYSPFNMFVNQLTGNKFKAKNSKGKEFDWQMKTQKPELHEFLSRWSNSLAGMPNVVHGPSLRFLESGVQKLSKNLTAAVLGWSIRTIAVQPTAMLPTTAEFGITPTVKGLTRTSIRSGKDPINLSNELPNRKADAFINDIVSNKLHGPVGRTLTLPREKALSAMQFVDYVAAEATWRTAFESSKHLGKESAARLADEAVVRTQGSGFVGDLSPIQMNALGKAVTLWQTYTINHMNWIAREVLNVKHPERSPVETARRVLTYVVGTAMINNIFEEQLGIQSPQPAPIKEFIKAMKRGDSDAAAVYQGLRELTELAPLASSLKFGSSPAGAVAEFLKELSTAAADDLPRALNGDKKAMKRVGFVAAKLWGVPGTQQIKRFDQGTPLGFPVKEAAGKKRKKSRRKRKSRQRRN